MGDAIVVVVIVVALVLALSPAARRWLREGRSEALVDPNQNITLDSISGLPGIYRYTFRNRFLPRGRRHAAPPNTPIRRHDDRADLEDRR
jgi:hypothetical protein